MAMRRSWLATAVVRKTSPISAPLRLNPPQVPALMSRCASSSLSAFIFCSVRKVAIAAGTVPTLSTPVPCTSSLPLVMTVRLQLLCLPRKAWKGVSDGKKDLSGWSWRWLMKGLASASMAIATTTLEMVIVY